MLQCFQLSPAVSREGVKTPTVCGRVRQWGWTRSPVRKNDVKSYKERLNAAQNVVWVLSITDKSANSRCLFYAFP